jgi:protein-S-isoprenylcysteine O-methyltransferase Ste14
MLTASWLFNFIPWWAWIVAAAVALGFTFQFWAPIWAVMPKWLKATIIFLASVAAAFIAGRNRGSKDERDMRQQADAHAVERRKDTDHEVANLDKPAADDRLKPWLRD